MPGELTTDEFVNILGAVDFKGAVSTNKILLLSTTPSVMIVSSTMTGIAKEVGLTVKVTGSIAGVDQSSAGFIAIGAVSTTSGLGFSYEGYTLKKEKVTLEGIVAVGPPLDDAHQLDDIAIFTCGGPSNIVDSHQITGGHVGISDAKVELDGGLAVYAPSLTIPLAKQSESIVGEATGEYFLPQNNK